ncbi:hypothetical protein B0H19DRAFT_1225943 [Mycena capillaripes]|nr:hypothetical protein B0H19DRAFT_1225943 [Mycena capillaripes]
MLYNPNYLQGSAMAALTWVVYDVCLNLDREIVSVWRTLLFAPTLAEFSQILSHGMQYIPDSSVPSHLQYTNAARWYIGLTEVLSILAGELLILIRINTVYGWSHKTETVIALVTTVISLLGGSRGLFGSTNILICGPDRVNVPDVNIANPEHGSTVWLTSMAVACVYVGLVIHKSLDVLQDIEAADGRPKAHKVSLITYFKASRVALPIFHLCLRDAGTGAAGKPAPGCIPQPLRPIGVSSTRIFLNLKELALSAHKYSGATWSEFQQNSALELQLRSGLRTRTSHDRRTIYETPPAGVLDAVDTQRYLP